MRSDGPCSSKADSVLRCSCAAGALARAGFSFVFKALFSAQEDFATLGGTATWLFYAALGAFEPSDLHRSAVTQGAEESSLISRSDPTVPEHFAGGGPSGTGPCYTARRSDQGRSRDRFCQWLWSFPAATEAALCFGALPTQVTSTLALGSWLTVSMLMLLNLLIAMFADTVSAVPHNFAMRDVCLLR